VAGIDAGPAGDYTMRARITRCSGEESIVEQEIAVPGHKPTVTLVPLDDDKSRPASSGASQTANGGRTSVSSGSPMAGRFST
jgi:hypothetical protein